ncbi:332_t:CDS:2 [Entrophospora sp. SA101]|nr:7715_t:CDS:2 [Entrophospora sp. SA101]CAJ0754101.1 332_t:CDS:2 [Entrophospora sp. SA101]
MSLSNLRSFAYNILKKLGDVVVKDRHFVEIGSCGECGNEILGLVYEPFTILACGHIYHRKCIEKNFLSNICPTSDCNKSVDPVATERRFSQSSQSSTSSIVRRMSNQLQLNSPVIGEEDEEMRDVEVKEKKEDARRDTRKSRPKRATKPKAIIQELSVVSTSSGPSISAPSETTNIGEISNQFHKLYYDVDIAEKKGDQENRDVIQCYFRFGRALSERLAVLLMNNPPQTARTKLNKEVKEKLPKKNRTDTARKIYDVFNKIGEDIIKNFPLNVQLKSRKMDEKADKRVHRTFQESKTGEPNICSVWCRGEDGKTTTLSTNSNNNHMGRGSPSLDNLHHENEGFRGNGTSKPEKISFQNANYLGRQNHNDEYGKVALPNSSKYNDFSGKGEDCKIYVRGVSPHVTKDQQISSTVEGRIYTNPTIAPFECCPNMQTIQSSLFSFGQLRRIGTLAGHAWTKEEPKTPCRFVVPNIQSIEERISETMSPVPKGEEQDEPREGRNNPKSPLMIVEMIANKSDRKRVANSLNCKLEPGDFSGCICYMEQVKEYYGFDHIIIIGELHAGILFLDCYGRVFIWDSMCYILWMLGDYWNEATKTSQPKWGLEVDWTVVRFEEFMNDSPNELTFNNPIHPVAKKKKNLKKKNSKKKQY